MAISIPGGRVFRTAPFISFLSGGDIKVITSQTEQFTGDAVIKFEGLLNFTQFALQVNHNASDDGPTLQLARRIFSAGFNGEATFFTGEDFVDNTGTVAMPSGSDQTIFDLQIRTLNELFLVVTLNGVTSVDIQSVLVARNPGR